MTQATTTQPHALVRRSERNGVRNHATWVVASVLGVEAGLLGLEHGYFEALQGNVALGRMLINAIGPQAENVWEGREPALTIIPNLRVTGIAAIITSAVVTLWAAVGLRRKRGGLLLMAFSLAQLLVGGGLAPISIGLTAGAVGTQIDVPLPWWRGHLPVRFQRILARLWPWPLIAHLALGAVSLEIAVFGKDGSVRWAARSLPPVIFGLLLLTLLSALAHDLQRQPDAQRMFPR